MAPLADTALGATRCRASGGKKNAWLRHPEQRAVSVVASAINLIVARKLMAAGREHRSLVLETDGPRLMTDATVFTHREPCEDPASFADTELDRPAGDPAHPA